MRSILLFALCSLLPAGALRAAEPSPLLREAKTLEKRADAYLDRGLREQALALLFQAKGLRDRAAEEAREKADPARQVEALFGRIDKDLAAGSTKEARMDLGRLRKLVLPLCGPAPPRQRARNTPPPRPPLPAAKSTSDRLAGLRDRVRRLEAELARLDREVAALSDR